MLEAGVRKSLWGYQGKEENQVILEEIKKIRRT